MVSIDFVSDSQQINTTTSNIFLYTGNIIWLVVFMCSFLMSSKPDALLLQSLDIAFKISFSEIGWFMISLSVWSKSVLNSNPS